MKVYPLNAHVPLKGHLHLDIFHLHKIFILTKPYSFRVFRTAIYYEKNNQLEKNNLTYFFFDLK